LRSQLFDFCQVLGVVWRWLPFEQSRPECERQAVTPASSCSLDVVTYNVSEKARRGTTGGLTVREAPRHRGTEQMIYGNVKQAGNLGQRWNIWRA
jgi:hypothetical protein